MKSKELKELIRKVYLDAESILPRTTKQAFEKVLASETEHLARANMQTLIDAAVIAEKNGRSACSDTGNPIWYVILGTKAMSVLEDGAPGLEEAISQVTSELTEEGWLQALMVDPIKHGLNTNVGLRIPDIHYKFRRADYIEIIATPKGCGAEGYGSHFKELMYADGITGIKKYIMDCFIEGARAGRTCPPNIVGIGIGGTSDLAPRMAKEAALLRPVGSRNPDPEVAALELELMKAMNATGIGPAGMGGNNSTLDVHIEIAHACIVAFPCAMSIQCPASHINVARIYSDGRVERDDKTSWFER